MDDEVASRDFGHQTSEETTVDGFSAPIVDNLAVASGHVDTAIESSNVTNLATGLKTQPATSDDMDTTSSTTLRAMDCEVLSHSQDPVKESKSNNPKSQIQIDPETKQEYIAVRSSEGALIGEMDSELLPNTADSIEKTVAVKESVATNCKETLAEHKAEQENYQTVSTEDMEVTATPPGTTDLSKRVSQPAVATVTNLEFLQKSEGLSSITQYRGDSSDDLSSDSDSDSDSSSSSSSSSSSGQLHIVLEEGDQEEDLGKEKASVPPKTQDEVLIDELPAVEDLHISVPEGTELRPMGLISSIVEKLVIVESFKDTPPLNDDSVIFNEKREAIGKVFEVFGPVVQPFYVLRFNSDKDITEKGLTQKATVYFAPGVKDFTDYIFTERLKKLKGSDASWKNDQEPPPEALDYSDDEQEALAKRKLKEQRREENAEADGDKEKLKPNNKKPPRREARQAWGPRPRGSPNPRAGPHSPRGSYQHHLPNPHFRPPPPMDSGYNQHHHLPYPPPFQAPPPYFPMYPGPPPAHMPWPPHPFPGMFMPPPPPPPPQPPHSTNQHRH